MVLAVAGWIGADVAWSASTPMAVLIAGLGLAAASTVRRSPVGLVLATLVVCSHLGARADEAYRPLDPGPFRSTATVLGDPDRFGAASRLELRLPTGHRIEATAFGSAGAVFDTTAIGATILIEGRLRSMENPGRFRHRHITGLASVERATPVDGPEPWHQIPEFFRDRIADGGATMAGPRRSLYLGLVIGDDRSQTLGQQLRFRISGLTHLLAVSGQNVAFVLAVARPLLESLGYRARFVAVLAVLVVFAMITRLEPSVLRATTTAAIAAWATMSGRERSGLQVLAVAVLGLVCVDPFLVDAVGFQLSVAASAGILLLQPAIESRLRGPRWLRGPLATTLSAQIGVCPLLAMYFGPVSIASVPANVVAGWAAALIMTIGLTVGVVAGLSPEGAASIMQLPTEALLWWIEAVATFHARLPAPRLGPLDAVGLAGFWMLVRSRALPVVVRSALVAAGLGLLIAAVPRASGPAVCGPGVAWFPPSDAGPAVLVVGPEAEGRSLADCRASGVRRVDLLIVERGSAHVGELVGAAQQLLDVAVIRAPPQHRIVGARRLLHKMVIPTSKGSLVVTPSADGHHLDVRLAARVDAGSPPPQPTGSR